MGNLSTPEQAAVYALGVATAQAHLDAGAPDGVPEILRETLRLAEVA